MIFAALVAGGQGTRMGGSLPKQLMMLGDKPVLIHTLHCFLRHPQIDGAVIGIAPDRYEEAAALIQQYCPTAPVYLTEGGTNRNETIVRIIDYMQSVLSCPPDTLVLSHDAVRPFVTDKIISDSIAAMQQYAICTAAVPETDTVAWTDDTQTADHFPDRAHLYRIQTPQTFRISHFRQVYEPLSDDRKAAATDVCSLFRQSGLPVGLIAGDRRNIKLTYPEDWHYAELLLHQHDE